MTPFGRATNPHYCGCPKVRGGWGADALTLAVGTMTTMEHLVDINNSIANAAILGD
jgi:hypothetical protein